MAYEEKPYYVGLLTAAAVHGASHQSPQEFQVVTTTPLRPIEIGPLRIHFFTKRHAERTPRAQVKVETGRMFVSSPDVTALDLLRYLPSVGHLNNVATILSELAEKLTPAGLVDAAAAGGELSHVQRLGYLLELVEQPKLAASLEPWLLSQKPRPIPLSPGRPVKGYELNKRWQVIVNEDVEAEA
jgi:predicted transcriptional regulator of viral defense system